MLYDYQYTVIAALVSAVLLTLIYQRKGYPSPSNRVFMRMMYVNLLATCADIFTFWTISFPERYPAWVLYGSNILYLWIFGMLPLMFARYLAALSGDERIKRVCRIQCAAAAGIEGVLLIASPLTGWVFTYGADLVYRHGPLFWILYAIPVLLIADTLLMMFARKAPISRLQSLTLGTVFLIGAVMAVIQIAIPKADMFHMSCALILLTVYIVLENPLYYTYRGTRCLGARAFFTELRQMKEPSTRLLLVCLTNRARDRGVQEIRLMTALTDEAAERMHEKFGRSAYCIAPGKFVVIGDPHTGKGPDDMADTARNAFMRPFNLYGKQIEARFGMRPMTLGDIMVSDDFADHFAEVIEQTSAERLLSVPDLTELLRSQHEYREVEDAVISGIENDRFYLMYQPIYDIAGGDFHSAEALLRLEDPQLGNVRPDIFIPIAERNGRITRIGDMVLEKACAFLKAHRADCPKLRYLEINVSPVQLLRADMADRFIGIMQKYGIAPDMINLEITESSLDLSEPAVVENIRKLRRFGASFSIDDYGSGFASASYLFRLPVSIVKIDRTILNEAMRDEKAMLVFGDTVRMVKKLGKTVIVEGAEDEEMARRIKESGGDQIQGYHYSRPLREEAFIQFMA